MRRLLGLFAILLICAAIAAAADDSSATPATQPAPAPAPAAYPAGEQNRWQLGIGYEYFRADVGGGDSLNLHGFSTSMTRFMTDWIGLEAVVGGAFGDAPGGVRAKLVTYGGGPKVAYRHNSKFEPWGHAIFGGAHLFPQTSLGSTQAFEYELGGGFDFKIRPRVYWRAEGDYVATRFFSQWQHNAQFRTGLVFNF